MRERELLRPWRAAGSARLLLLPLLVTVFTHCLGGTGPGDSPPDVPKTGTAVPALAGVDDVATIVMDRWSLPGAAIAIVKDGRLVFARGYGFADLGDEELVQPDALFRIAGVTKPITATAVMKLVEDGQLTLDELAFPHLDYLEPAPDATVDPRLNDITIRQVLLHAAGWDRTQSFDPMFVPLIAAEAVGEPAPASAETVIRYMLGIPLDFDPGDRYAYSNFGYNVLGRIIEQVTGTTYEAHMRTAVLAPMGIQRMRLGRTAFDERADGEVLYYFDNGRLTTSVFAGEGQVPIPYGGFYLDAMDSHGGWIASTIDLMRFVTSVDGLPERPDFLSAASVASMTARPPPPLWADSDFYYGFGWVVEPEDGGVRWSHGGLLPGSSAVLVREPDGVAWVALTNTAPPDLSSAISGEFVARLGPVLSAVDPWPTHDLFGQFP